MRERALIGWLVPGALAVLVMLPRLAVAQFGLLDDGLTLQTGRETVGRWSSVLALIPETGRFFPAYWLAYSGLFALAGARPWAFYVLNVVVLVGLVALLARLVRLSGGTPLQAALAGVLVVACGPAIEAFYTLSKAEPLQVTWIGISLVATATSARAGSGPRRVMSLTLAAAALVLAHATKETTIALIPISLAWLAIEWTGLGGASSGYARFARTYALINVGAAAVFWAARSAHAPLALAEGSYTRAYTLQPATVGPAIFRICAWLVRDFAFLLPLLMAACIGLWRGRREWRRPILYAGAWMSGWLAVFVPWPATFEYHLLPFALGAAYLAGLVVGGLWSLRERQAPVRTRRLAWAALAASALLWVPGIVNATADARIQLTVDGANSDLVDFLASLPGSSRVVLNTTFPNEYLYELPMHLGELKRRGDLIVQHVGAAALARPGGDVFVVTATMVNQPGPTVRIALHEAGVQSDNHRLRELLRAGGEAVYRGERQAWVVEVGLHRLLCPVAVRPVFDATYCPADRGVVYARVFAYGWQVHRLGQPATARLGAPS